MNFEQRLLTPEGLLTPCYPTPKTTSFRHMKLHVKSQIVMYVNGRPSLHINLRIVFIYCTKQLNHHLYIHFIVMYKQLNLAPVYNIIFMSGAHGVAGGCGVGAAGCLWIGGCSMLWRLGGFGAIVFGNTAELGARGFP